MMTKTTIQKALTLVGAAYLLNCGSTVFVELAEDTGGGATVASSTSGGGMGGNVAWAQNITFNVIRVQCEPHPQLAGIARIPDDGWNTELWPMVRTMRVVVNPQEDLLGIAPGSTEVNHQTDVYGLLQFDNGKRACSCQGAEEMIVALPVVVD